MNKLEKTFILNLPVIDLIFNIAVSLAAVKGGAEAILRAAYLLSVIIYVYAHRMQFRFEKEEKTIVYFSIYMIVLVFFASDFLFSSTNVLKVLIVLNMYVVFKTMIKTRYQFIYLLKNYFVVLFVFVLNTLSAQFFKFGVSGYLEDTFYGGIFGVRAAEQMAVILITVPFYFMSLNRFKKYFYMAIIVLAASMIFLFLRRTAIIMLLIALGLYIFYNRTNIKYSFYILTFLVFGTIVFSIFFYDTFEVRYQARQAKQIQWYESESFVSVEEGRFQDPINGISRMFDLGLAAVLFGGEIFNSKEFMDSHRELHNGYAALITGTGLIGIILFYSLMYGIFKNFKIFENLNSYLFNTVRSRYKEVINDQHLIKILFFVILAFLVSGRLHNISVPLIVYIVMGAYVGFMKHSANILSQRV
jgi:hypothetical protein